MHEENTWLRDEESIRDMPIVPLVKQQHVCWDDREFFHVVDIFDLFDEQVGEKNGIILRLPSRPRTAEEYETGIRRFFEDTPLPIYDVVYRYPRYDAEADFVGLGLNPGDMSEEVIGLVNRLNEKLAEEHDSCFSGENRIDPKDIADAFLNRMTFEDFTASIDRGYLTVRFDNEAD